MAAAGLVTTGEVFQFGEFQPLTGVSKKLVLIWPICEMGTLVKGQALGSHGHNHRQ